MLKHEGTDKIRDIKYEDGYVDKIYYDNNTQLVFTSDKEKTDVDEVQFKGRKLVDVTSYGKCEQNGTPTPDAPVDIVCNNGVLKARHQSGLPLGYTLLDYIESTGTQYIDTGIKGNQNIKVDIDFIVVDNGNFWPFGARTTANTMSFAIWSSTGIINGAFRVGFDNTSGYTGSNGSAQKNTRFRVVHSKDGTHINDTLVWTVSDYSDFTTTNNLLAFATYDGTTIQKTATKLYSLKLWNNGTLVRNFVAAKDSNNVVGMYDLVSGQFFTNQGTGTFTAGDPVSDPVEIYTDGTVETIDVHGKNLFNILTDNTGQGWWVNNGVVDNAASANRTIVIDCKPNTVYSWWHTEGAGGCRAFVLNKDTIEDGDTASWLTAANPTYKEKDVVTTITTPADAKKLYILVGRRDVVVSRSFEDQLADFMVVEGEVETALPYAPYYNGGSLECPMLLSVGG